MLYCRSYGGSQMLVSEGTVGETLAAPDNEQGDISMDYVVDIGAQVAERFPAYEAAGLASQWTGVYDVTPDWNPVLGRVPGLEGLIVGYGFSGHGFKLSPAVGRVLAQEALGLPTDDDYPLDEVLDDLADEAREALGRLKGEQRELDEEVETAMSRAVKKASQRIWGRRPVVETTVLRI
jgi:glycine/D-amino acid oxidase-like deaminating enzyme